MNICTYEIVSLHHRSTDHYENWPVYIPTRWCYSIPTSSPFNQSASCQHGRQNYANLALSPTFRYVSIESPLECKERGCLRILQI
ncbi:UNVERIFIED_CONTAM: hypothetical protein NCL1_04042 [Trichonephila clavipes]